MVPLPFTCQHEAYDQVDLEDLPFPIPVTFGADGNDEHGNPVPGWADPAPVACFWWSADSTEPGYQSRTPQNAGSDQAVVDLILVVDSAVAVDHRDKFTVEGRQFEVVGLPKDFDHGPFGFTPNRQVIELKWVG